MSVNYRNPDKTLTLLANVSSGGSGSGGPVDQVQADWSATNESHPSFIKNKPNMDDYLRKDDLTPITPEDPDTPTIPQQLQADWDEVDATKASYIKNKPRGLVTEDTLSPELEKYLKLTGGEVTGSVTTTKTSFSNDQELVSKRYVDRKMPDVSNFVTNEKLEDYLPLTGGQVKGAVSTTKTTFADNDFVTKKYVDDNKTELVKPDWTAPESSAAGILNKPDNLGTTGAEGNVYTKQEVDNFIQNVSSLKYKVIDTLPIVGEDGTIYLIPIDPNDSSKGYHQWAYSDNNWIDLGTTTIDLANYYTKVESDNRFLNLSGGKVTGAVTTDRITFGDKEFITKRYVDNSIPDISNLAEKTDLTDYLKKENLTDGSIDNIIINNDDRQTEISGSTIRTTNIQAIDDLLTFKADSNIILKGSNIQDDTNNPHWKISSLGDASFASLAENGVLLEDKYLQLSGGNVTDSVTTDKTTFTNNQEFVTKKYVDDKQPDLSQYPTKTEVYTKTEVKNIVNEAISINYKIVDALPDVGEKGTTYLVPVNSADSTQGYHQWVYSDDEWIDLGTTTVNLSDYYTKAQSDNKFLAKEGGQVTGTLSTTKTIFSDDFEFVSKKYVDEVADSSDKYVKKSGDLMTGSLEMAYDSYYNILNGTGLALREYSDGNVKRAANIYTNSIRYQYTENDNKTSGFSAEGTSLRMHSHDNNFFEVTTDLFHYANANEVIEVISSGAMTTTRTDFTMNNEFITKSFVNSNFLSLTGGKLSGDKVSILPTGLFGTTVGGEIPVIQGFKIKELEDYVKKEDFGIITPSTPTDPTASEQLQADWSETDNSKVSYIKNKPNIINNVELDAIDDNNGNVTLVINIT